MGFTPEDHQRALAHFSLVDEKIYAVLLKHGYLQPTPRRGLYPLLLGTIIGQRIRFTLARTLRGKLYRRLGTDNFGPLEIMNCGMTGLLEIGISLIVVETILRLTRYVMLNNISLCSIQDLSLIAHLKGIGPWTLSCTKIMFSLNEDDQSFDDTLLYEDLIIRRGLKKLYGWTTPAQFRQGSQGWKPWRGIVTWYLWKEFT